VPGPHFPTVHVDAESPSMPGVRSCVSDPLDMWCTRDDFFDEMLALIKEPIGPNDLCVLKEIQLEELGPTEFHVKVYLDGASLHDINSPEKRETTRDVCRADVRLIWDKVKYEMLVHTRDHDTGKLRNTIRVNFLSNPFRLEFLFVYNPDNGETSMLGWIAENMWIKPVVWEFMRRRTTLERNVESPYGNGDMVAISEPLDEWLDYDTLWGLFLKYIKSTAVHCEEVSDSEFEITVMDPIHGGHPHKPLVRLIKHDKNTGEVVDVASVDNLKLVDTRHVVIHQDPLRMEAWTIGAKGKRTYKHLNTSFLLQWFLDAVIPKKDSGVNAKVSENANVSTTGKTQPAEVAEGCVLM